jgi:NADH:ubiquinone oxidoreductase subunit 3 (subunit A)
MTNESVSLPERPKRSLSLRILFGFLWFIAFYFLTNILVGGIVGAIAGASTNRDSGATQTFNQSFEAGRNAGHQASVNFFHKYGLVVFLVQILVFAILCFFAVLPGVGKYKRLKKA